MQEVAAIEEHPLLHVTGMRPGAAFPAELQRLQYSWVIAELDDEVCRVVRGPRVAWGHVDVRGRWWRTRGGGCRCLLEGRSVV